MNLPDLTLTPSKRAVFKTREAIKALRVSPTTFYNYKRLLGITPRKKKGSPCRWYSYWDVWQLMDAIYRPWQFIAAGLQCERQEYRERQRSGGNV